MHRFKIAALGTAALLLPAVFRSEKTASWTRPRRPDAVAVAAGFQALPAEAPPAARPRGASATPAPVPVPPDWTRDHPDALGSWLLGLSDQDLKRLEREGAFAGIFDRIVGDIHARHADPVESARALDEFLGRLNARRMSR